MPARRSRERRTVVTVYAGVRASRAHASPTSLLVFAALGAGFAAPANADAGATASLYSDLQFRGYSLSAGRPVAILDFAYDDPSGFYVDASGTGVLRSSRPEPLGLQLTGGYARRLKSGTSLDFGITHSTYSAYSSAGRSNSYTEVYAGIARGALSSRIFLSPHYFESRRWSAYGEVNASVSPLRRWDVDGHLGLHVPLRAPANESYRPEVDWRLGLTRELGPLSIHASWSGGAPGRDTYRGRYRSRSALVLGASWVL
jgi:uncharacterized protein (TIGR02001 family)